MAGSRLRCRGWSYFPEVPSATFLTALLSLVVSGPRVFLMPRPLAPSCLSLQNEALRNGQVHRLVTYIFVYEHPVSLLCGAAVILRYAGNFERSVGTVRHCFFTLVFTLVTAIIFLLCETVISVVHHAEVEAAVGFSPVAFAMMGLTSVRSRMRRVLVLGIFVPTVVAPWFVLCAYCFIPQTSFLGNFCGLCVGIAYGISYCSFDISERTALKLDRTFPFYLMQRLFMVKYISSCAAERRAANCRRIKPTPGSYPTQCSCTHKSLNRMMQAQQTSGVQGLIPGNMPSPPPYQPASSPNSTQNNGGPAPHVPGGYPDLTGVSLGVQAPAPLNCSDVHSENLVAPGVAGPNDCARVLIP